MPMELEHEIATMSLVGEKARLKSIMDTTVEGVFSLDQQGEIETLNGAAERLFGYRKDELIGDSFSRLLAGLESERFAEFIRACGSAARSGRDSEFTARRQTGATFPVRLCLGDFQVGHRRCFTLIVTDLSEQKNAEQRATQAERLAAIGETITCLTHETRNALQLSQANLDLLTLDLQDRPEALRLVDRIKSAQDRISRLFEEMRDFAAPVVLYREPCDLAELITQVLDEVVPIHSSRKVRLTQCANGIDTNCVVDSFHMHQVFRNLLENSIQASPDPVQIEVQWSSSRLDGAAAVEISLRDNGPGLPVDQRCHVFDAFFTTKKGGTGLGLSIARQIVGAHGGRIAVGDSTSGAEFMITLPRRIPVQHSPNCRCDSAR